MQGDALLPAYTDNTEKIMKELLIFLGGAMCGSFVSILLFCAITVGKSKDSEYRNGDQYLCSKENYARNAKRVNIHTSLTDVPRCALILVVITERNALCMSSWRNRKKEAFGNVYWGMVKLCYPPRKQVLCGNLEPPAVCLCAISKNKQETCLYR